MSRRLSAVLSNLGPSPAKSGTGGQAKTIHVPHLGGIDAGYQLAAPYDAKKPTIVLVNSFMTSSELYRPQFGNKELTDAANLLAIEVLGHGLTRTKVENYTYWDTAMMNLQVLDALKIKGKVFALGTSQGGWIVARMALLAPDRIAGLIPLGTSLDTESERTRQLGCWDGVASTTPLIQGWTSKTATPDFALPDEFLDFLNEAGFGKGASAETREYWSRVTKANFRGDDGRRRARMNAINLGTRDGLHHRLSDIRAPVLWLHGTDDAVYSVANAHDEIKLFSGSPEASVQVVPGGAHYLSHSSPREVDAALIAFVKRYHRQ